MSRAEDALTNARRAAAALPGIRQFRRYHRRWLRRDVLAGVTVAAFLIPQVMGYATMAGLPPVAGLWASVLPLAVYAMLGSSRQLSIGPESTTALMTAATLGTMTLTNPDQLVATASVLALLTGAVCLAARLFRAGYLSQLLSRPILLGYMLGIAILMIVSQLGHVSGVELPRGSLLTQLQYLSAHLADLELTPIVLSAGILIVLFVGSHVSPRFPWPLLVIVTAAAAAQLVPVLSGHLELIGPIPVGLPPVGFSGFDWTQTPALVPAALGLAAVAYSDTVLTGRAFAAEAGDRTDANQELVALGAANVMAGLSHGFPISSSASRTALAHALNARTQLYSVVAAAVVVATVAFATPVLSAFPLCALGAIVIYAAVRLVDPTELRRLARFRRSEAALAVLTAVAVIIFGVLWGVLVAIALSLADLLRRIVKPHDAVLGLVPGLAGMHDVRDHDHADQVPGLLVYRYDSPLFFANAADFVERALEAVDAADPPVRWFVLDAEANINVDLTAADALEELRRRLERRDVVFSVAHLRTEMRQALAATGWLGRIGEDRQFETLPTAVDAYRRWLASHPGRG